MVEEKPGVKMFFFFLIYEKKCIENRNLFDLRIISFIRESSFEFTAKVPALPFLLFPF